MTRILLVVALVSFLIGGAVVANGRVGGTPSSPEAEAAPLQIDSDPWLDNDRESTRDSGAADRGRL